MAEGGLALELKQALALLVLIKAHRQGRVDHTWKSRVDETFPMKSNSWLNQGYIRKGNKFVQSMSRKKHRLYDQGLGKVAAKTSKDIDVLVKFVSKGSGLSYYLGKKRKIWA
jgi:hypothetical protein